MNYIKQVVFLLFAVCLPCFVAAQSYYRLKADFSIKEKDKEGRSKLIVGKVYYDMTNKKLVFVHTFPQAETSVVRDTILYNYNSEKQLEKIPGQYNLDFTIFHLCLNGNLANYGLQNSIFKIEKVEKEKDMVITTWTPQIKNDNVLGKVMISTKNKLLYGVVFINQKNEVIKKQFYEKYFNSSGLMFPGEVIDITIVGGKEYYKVTTYKNVKVNSSDENHIYNYPLPE